MSFEIPRLRRLTAGILQKYKEFLKNSRPYLRSLHADLLVASYDLAKRCELLMQESADVASLDLFINDLKLFLSTNASQAFSEDDEKIGRAHV